MLKKINWDKLITISAAVMGSFVLVAMLAAGSLAFIAQNKYFAFLKAADLTHNQFIMTLAQAAKTDKFQQNDRVNLLLLGVDSLEHRPGSPALTDTIILFSIDLSNNQIKSVALPRDLWNQAYQTKINALYVYGHERTPEEPEIFAQLAIEQMTQVPINYTAVVSLDQVAELIDLLGGIEVDVKNGFIDNQFPRTDVDVTQVTDPDKLYQTIEFKPGKQKMDGQRALQYIRSRKSSDEQGNDLARAERQQQVVQALAQKLTNPKLYWQKPEIAGGLFRFYQQHFSQDLPLGDLFNIAEYLLPDIKQIKYQSSGLSVYPEDENGLIFHPQDTQADYKYNGQWVFEVREPEEFKQQVQQMLFCGTGPKP